MRQTACSSCVTENNYPIEILSEIVCRTMHDEHEEERLCTDIKLEHHSHRSYIELIVWHDVIISFL